MDLLPPTTTLAEVERVHILRTLQLCEGNRTRAAKILDVSIRGLRNKLRDYRATGHHVPDAQVGQIMN